MNISQIVLHIFRAVVGVLVLILATIDTAQAARWGRSHNRIVSGINVTPVNKYPMMVAFLYQGTQVCGGTILNKYYVLSTAGCAGAVTGSPKDFSILAGTYQLGDPDPRYVQNISCKSATVHVRYQDNSKGSIANEIGVIRLSRPLIWNDHVAPTNFPVPGWTVLPSERINAIAVGWGLGKNESYPFGPTRPLQEVELPLLTTEDCQRVVSRFVTEDQVCTEAGEGTGPCIDDHGGPLFIYNELQDKHIQIGITASVDGYCGNHPPGFTIVPPEYTKVSKYIHWIEEAIRECNPPRAI